jgi:hypothetical protein
MNLEDNIDISELSERLLTYDKSGKAQGFSPRLSRFCRNFYGIICDLNLVNYRIQQALTISKRFRNNY